MLISNSLELNSLARVCCLSVVSLLCLVGCGNGSGDEPKKQSVATSEGENLVSKNCFVCHGQGINGAPIVGNKKMWSKRLDQGLPVLIDHAINGYGLMPAKGGKTELTDEEIALAVTYMVEQVTD